MLNHSISNISEKNSSLSEAHFSCFNSTEDFDLNLEDLIGFPQPEKKEVINSYIIGD